MMNEKKRCKGMKNTMNKERIVAARKCLLEVLKQADVNVEPTTIGDTKKRVTRGESTSVDQDNLRVQMYRLAIKNRGTGKDWYMYLKVSDEYATLNAKEDFYGFSEKVFKELDEEEVDYFLCLVDSAISTGDYDLTTPYVWLYDQEDIQKIRGNCTTSKDGVYKCNRKRLEELTGKKGVSIPAFIEFFASCS